jgi:hypothetical protein
MRSCQAGLPQGIPLGQPQTMAVRSASDRDQAEARLYGFFHEMQGGGALARQVMRSYNEVTQPGHATRSCNPGIGLLTGQPMQDIRELDGELGAFADLLGARRIDL